MSLYNNDKGLYGVQHDTTAVSQQGLSPAPILLQSNLRATRNLLEYYLKPFSQSIQNKTASKLDVK